VHSYIWGQLIGLQKRKSSWGHLSQMFLLATESTWEKHLNTSPCTRHMWLLTLNGSHILLSAVMLVFHHLFFPSSRLPLLASCAVHSHAAVLPQQEQHSDRSVPPQPRGEEQLSVRELLEPPVAERPRSWGFPRLPQQTEVPDVLCREVSEPGGNTKATQSVTGCPDCSGFKNNTSQS